MESHTEYGIYAMSTIEADPFRNGTGCCIVYKCACRYKRAMNAIGDGFRMADAWDGIRMMGLVE